MPTTEHTINDALAGVLRETRRAWSSSDIVRSENTGMLKGSNKRPDILVLEANVSPVCIETEVLPAITVESEALARLGEQIRTTGRTILSSIAVRLPDRIRTKQGASLRDELADAGDLEMALYTGTNQSKHSRWPKSGWVLGSVADLSILAQSASVPPDVIEIAADQLVNGVSEGAALLEEIVKSHPGAVHKISEELHQEDGEQTRRMATTILANAFVFQESLAGGPGKLQDVKSLDELRSSSGGLNKSAILTEWRKILKVNYWPIFDIARRILEVIPAVDSKALIKRMAETAERLLENRLMRSHDLTGAVFQRLIADRKFLAAYYTSPSSAALLVGLAITPGNPPAKGSWSNVDDVKTLRIADFACGTGTLLSTAYQRVGQLHEIAGGDAEAIHPDMMAACLIGCDVLPAAAHLTASMLSGAHPTVRYKNSSVMTVAYGKLPDGGIALGSLDLLNPQGSLGILPITAKSIEGMGESERETWSSLPHASFDLVIMNPPFTRNTRHEAESSNVPLPMFAAFGSDIEEQELMAKAAKKLTAGTSAHGNAGEASIFLVLADRKLKSNGILAMVMPLSLISGDAWENSRKLIARNYSNLIVVTIAGIDGSPLSFSADTKMGECLIVGQKNKKGSKRGTFIILGRQPHSPMLGANIARQIIFSINNENIKRLEDGPVGGTPICFGDDLIGHAIDAPIPRSGGWNLSRIVDLFLAQTAFQLAVKGLLWLPTIKKSDAIEIPITTVSSFGTVGPIHRDINGTNPDGSYRGPFSVPKLKTKGVPTYPVLWSHEAKRELTMQFEADCEGLPRKGKSKEEQQVIDKKVADVWSTASCCHHNCDFRFNSQPTAMQFTSRPTIGGRAWISISLSSMDLEKVLVLWANTSIGIMLYWWHANKQQPGRGSIGKSALQDMPVLDVTSLSSKQISKAVQIFDKMSKAEMLPGHEMDKDSVRKQLDELFFQKVIGIDQSYFEPNGPFDLLRMKLSSEPSIRGQKK